jgi:hypothetical protein
MTPAQNQKQIDDAAEIQDLAEQYKRDLISSLEMNGHFEVTGAKECSVKDRDNVVDKMIHMDQVRFNWAVVWQDKAILAAMKEDAIQKIADEIDFGAMAAWEFKQMECAA